MIWLGLRSQFDQFFFPADCDLGKSSFLQAVVWTFQFGLAVLLYTTGREGPAGDSAFLLSPTWIKRSQDKDFAFGWKVLIVHPQIHLSNFLSDILILLDVLLWC